MCQLKFPWAWCPKPTHKVLLILCSFSQTGRDDGIVFIVKLESICQDEAPFPHPSEKTKMRCFGVGQHAASLECAE